MSVSERFSRADFPELLALRALGFLASDAAEFDRFLQRSGIVPDEISKPPFRKAVLAATLDFLVTNETALVRFSNAFDVPPEAAYEARRKFAN